ncbi:hypothetical protein HanPSC8_Chr07g0297511 [Helianthus annuus]|nr:hypothetical protein HanPSC8_Chr07g0297511 [Helianthus annuus]
MSIHVASKIRAYLFFFIEIGTRVVKTVYKMVGGVHRNNCETCLLFSDVSRNE